MEKLNVIGLAEHVNAQSLTGDLTDDLLRSGNDLYEVTQIPGKFRCLRANGEVFQGYFLDGIFVVEKILT